MSYYYAGSFDGNGNPEGYGIFCAPPSCYRGAVSQGQPNGYGKMIMRNGSFKGCQFLGQFKNGYPQGKGCWTYANGERKKGKFFTSPEDAYIGYQEADQGLVDLAVALAEEALDYASKVAKANLDKIIKLAIDEDEEVLNVMSLDDLEALRNS